MSVQSAFKSAGQASVSLTTTMVSVATAAAVPGLGESMMIVNACSVPVACDVGSVAPTVTAASPYIVPANSRLLISVPGQTALFAAAMPIGAASAAVYFMRGDGTLY